MVQQDLLPSNKVARNEAKQWLSSEDCAHARWVTGGKLRFSQRGALDPGENYKIIFGTPKKGN